MVLIENDLSSLSIDELWSLHEEISAVLSARMLDKKRELERRLAVLNYSGVGTEPVKDPPRPTHRKPRRRYPKVLPRYRNPETSETWAGRGKRPRWLTVAMETGRNMDEFLI